jgi:ribonuclease HI
MSPTRPKWAYIADELINTKLPNKKSIDKQSRTNIFMQSNDTNPNSRSNLPQDLISMIRTGHEFNVKVDAPLPSQELKEELPIWHHIGATHALKEMTNKPEAKCLRHKHQAQTVAEMDKIASHQSRQHIPRKNCRCTTCKATRRDTRCHNPHKCQQMAKKLIEQLHPKWNPHLFPPQDNLSLTPRRKRKNKQAHKTGDPITFDPNITSGNLQEGIRVFSSEETNTLPAFRTLQQRLQPEVTTVYTDGSCRNNGEETAQAGSGIWYGENDPRNKALRVPGQMQSNQAGELYAILHVVKTTPQEEALLIKTDSKYVINGLTRHLQQWENNGWIGVANKELFQTIAAWMRARGNTTDLQWVKGHSGEKGNEEADKLAAEGATLPHEEHLDLSTPENFTITGAQLSNMTQSSLYKGILEYKQTSETRGTKIQLDLTRWAIKDLSGKLPSDAIIWKSLRSKTITKSIREFLWKCMHNAHKVGKFWNNIPKYEQRATCPTCNEEESMEHILTECSIPGQQMIWNLTKTLWTKKYSTWPQLRYGMILGCSMGKFTNQAGHIKPGANRLFQILISESAYMIWKIRCERRIQNEDNPEKYHSETEIHNRWLAMINNRLSMDCLMTNKRRYGRKALKPKDVMLTWNGVLMDQENLPDNWLWQSGVLVGIRPKRPPGRNR